MNLPNKLTASRFVLTAAFVVVMFAEMPWHQTIALVIFSLAGITDFLDGRIARQRKLITNFGILMDPLADKIMTCSAFIAFVAMPETHVKVWMVVVIVARELAITGLRLIAASKNLVLAAEGFGKVVAHPCCTATLAFFGHGVGCQGNDRQIFELIKLPDRSDRFVAIHLRHHDVHQHRVDSGRGF